MDYRRAPNTSIVLAVLLAALAIDAEGQVLRGTVIDAVTQAPIVDGVVVALDDKGQQRAGTFTDLRGAFRLSVPPGRYQLRAERIGYQGVTTPLFDIAAGDTVDKPLVVAPAAAVVSSVVTVGRSACAPIAEAKPVADLWGQIHAALSAAVQTERERRTELSVVTYKRELDVLGRTVLSEHAEQRRHNGAVAFESIPAALLATTGFMTQVGDSLEYRAPDANVFISDSFVDTHCFHLAQFAGDSLVGLAFEPLRGRQRVEIAGTLWVHRPTGELRSIDYSYTSVAATRNQAAVGGRVTFNRLGSGRWIVGQWWIRMPVVRTAALTVPMRDLPVEPGPFRREGVETLIEVGGVVRAERASAPRTLVSARGAATAVGIAYDSVLRRPLVGATVRLLGTPRTATTRADGSYALDSLPPGEHELELTHPRLDSLGLPPIVQPVVLTDQTRTTVAFSTPSITTLERMFCAPITGSLPPGSQARMLTGRLVDSTNTRAVAGARVSLQWTVSSGPPRGFADIATTRTAAREPRSASTNVAADGTFRICTRYPISSARIEVTLDGMRVNPVNVDLRTDRVAHVVVRIRN